ncbi:hypothetical protein NQ314_009532 [Rhamnusium bicolor]|uniref:MENTAL domain-containing protein n=1 Tax=Rhamnusium bicolor TaxID=1586634 RepID=A0AAV8XZ74_9CUCU|nr:hypothetical protein NQ314_009532 [Rhamnusium bicolor]
MSTPEQEAGLSSHCVINSNNQQSQNVQSPLDMSHSHSINTIPSIRDYIISEDLLAGQRLHGRMSNVRRFFCLFVTFDLLFTSLMWIICIMISTGSTCAFLIAKVFVYDHGVRLGFLTSELYHKSQMQTDMLSVTATESERTPLIRSYVQGLPSLYTESVGNFYSPQGTPEGSLYRFEQRPNIYPPALFTREQVTPICIKKLDL